MDQIRPTPLKELREFHPTYPPTEEFSIRHWITSAHALIELTKSKWRAANQVNGDPRKAEDAFKDLRKAAECMGIILKHSRYQHMLSTKSPEYKSYLDLRGDMVQLQSIKEDIVAFLEKREAAWVAAHGPLSPTPSNPPPPKQNGSTALKSSPVVSDDGVGAFIDAYGSSSPPLSRMGHPVAASSSPPVPPSSASPPPPSSMQERLAALRNAGMKSTSTVRNSLPAAPVSTISSSQPPVASSSSSANIHSNGQSTTLQAPGSPPVPRKPKELQGGRSPPSSPSAKLASLADERSGSAPPAIKQSEAGRDRTGSNSGLGLNGVVPNGREPSPTNGLGFGGLDGLGSVDSHNRTEAWARRYDTVNGIVTPKTNLTGNGGERVPSPSEFAGNFPSLDDFEQRADFAPSRPPPPPLPLSSTYEGYNGTRSTAPWNGRPPLPPPPTAFDMGDLAADLPSSSTSLSFPTSATSPSASTAGRDVGAGAPSASKKAFQIPFTSDVSPTDLYNYLAMALAEKGQGPRVLLLDLRTREEFEKGRVAGEVVCIEPMIVHQGKRGPDIESSLTISPKDEQDMFASRNLYDMVVIYDRSSSSIPNYAPPSTASESQRVLWALNNIIYENEFSKSLKRQPVLLRGGWEAWEIKVGEKGIVRNGLPPAATSNGEAREVGHRRDPGEQVKLEAKRANRKVTVVSGDDSTQLRNGSDVVPLSPTSLTTAAGRPGDYFSPIASYNSNSFSGPGLMSPQLAMPSPAAQRPGAGQAYDYSLQSSLSNRPSYPQPEINSLSSSTSSLNGVASPGMPRPRSDFNDYGGAQSYSSSSPRPPIDYPQLRQSGYNSPNQAAYNSPSQPGYMSPTRPAPQPPQAALPPPVPLARPPPAVQPTPARSNSTFSGGLAVSPYSTPNMHTSRLASQIQFGDDHIGLTGLKNLGNTCYMNSTIQCLSATIPFARYFKAYICADSGYKRDINKSNTLGTKGALADAVAELIRAIWAQNYLFLSPVTFRENICRWAPQFRGTDQHDAQEFLGFLLDGLHEDLNYIIQKPPPVDMSPEREHDLETLPQQIMSEREWDIYRRRDDSFVVQCFQGQFRNQLKCLTCGKTSTTYNTFMPLSVPIPSGRGIGRVDLQQCISAFVREEILEKDDAWNCPRCKVPRKASKKLTLSRLPPILVIHLKRFSIRGPFSDKLETQVHYPLSGLDLTNHMPPPLMEKRPAALTSPPKGYVYDLYGVTNHYGNLSSGHYTAYVRSHDKWNSIGDSKVTEVDSSTVQSAKSAYILYFARR
ncbi:hypothetical protein T439DRAFT_299975 [Meredithblackwellia eburnea MCA 4105]